MPEAQDTEERPCLHCMMVELIEVIIALAKTVANLTCSQNGTGRQQIIETLMREIMEYDAEFRREDASGAVSSTARH